MYTGFGRLKDGNLLVSDKRALADYIKKHPGPIRLTIEPIQPDASSNQAGYFRKVVLPMIHRAMFENGTANSPEEVEDILCRMHPDMTNPVTIYVKGSPVYYQAVKPIEEADKASAAKFIEFCIDFAAAEYGILIPEPFSS